MRQNFNYSCGPACILALKDLISTNQIHQHSSDIESFYSDEMFTLPEIGTCENNLTNFALHDDILKEYLIDSGENTYHGRVAIANIRNHRTGIGHYVLFLKKQGDLIFYFDPVDGEVYEKLESEINWENHNGSIKKWSLNFDIDYDFRMTINHKRKIFILYGDFDLADERYDTVPFLESHYRSQGHPVSMSPESEILVQNDVLYLDGMKVSNGDVVWIKIDPRQDESYFQTLRILSLFEDRILFINKPSLILRYDDKFLVPSSLTIGSVDRTLKKNTLQKSVYPYKDSLVAKRMNGFGGKDVHVGKKENVIKEILEKGGARLLLNSA